MNEAKSDEDTIRTFPSQSRSDLTSEPGNWTRPLSLMVEVDSFKI